MGQILFLVPCLQKGEGRVFFLRTALHPSNIPRFNYWKNKWELANLGIVQFSRSAVTALSLQVTADIQLEVLRGQEMLKDPSVIPVEEY